MKVLLVKNHDSGNVNTRLPESLNKAQGIYPPLKLFLFGAYGIYQYNVGDDTIFYRKVTLTRKGLDEVKVEVEVKWTIKGQTHTLVVEDRLWNWK